MKGMEWGKRMQRKAQLIEEWFIQYSQDIYKFLCYSVKDHHDDLLQEVFLKALQGAYKYENIVNPKAWLFTIAKHVVVDYRRGKRDKEILQADEVDVLPDKIENHPLYHVLTNERERVLYKCLKKLKQSYQEVIFLKGIHDLTTAETAQILHWNENKVRLTLHRALKSFKKIIEEEGEIFNG